MNFSTSFFAGAPPVMPAFISCWMEQDVLRHAHDLAVDLASTGLNISFRNVSPTFVSRDGRPVGLPDTPLGNAFPRGFFRRLFRYLRTSVAVC